MRNHRNDLAKLVNTLTSEEKRHCLSRLEHSRSQHRKLFIKLLNAMGKDDFDEAAFKARHCAHLAPSTVSNIKHRLKGQVHRALVDFYAELTKEGHILQLVQRHQILLRKGLFDQCDQALEEAWDLAFRYEYVVLEQLVLANKGKLMSTRTVKHFGQDLARWTQRLSTVPELITVGSILLGVYQQVFMLHRDQRFCRTAEVRGQLDRLMDEPLLRQPERISCFHHRLTYHHIWEMYHEMTRDLEGAKAHQLQVRAIWDANPHQKEERPDRYRTMVSNLFGIHMCLKEFGHCEELLAEMDGLRLVSELDNAPFFAQTILMELQLSMNLCRSDLMRTALNRLRAGLRQYDDRIGTSSQVSMMFNAAVAHYLLGENRQALNWLTRMEAFGTQGPRKDLLDLGPLLKLMLHHTKGNLTGGETLLRSMKCHAGSGREWYSFETLVLNCLSKLSVADERLRRNALLDELVGALDRLPPADQQRLGFDEAVVWARSTRTGNSPLTVLQAHLSRGEEAAERKAYVRRPLTASPPAF